MAIQNRIGIRQADAKPLLMGVPNREAYLGAHGEVGRIVTWEVQATGRTQRMMLAADYRPSWDVPASAGLRLTRFLRLFGSYQRRNYSLLAKDGWYQGFCITLGMLP